MLRNYFLIALRSLWRNRLITFINLLGMSLGFGIFLSLWIFVSFELDFDRFHEDIDQMYILNVRLNMNGNEYVSERTGGVYKQVLYEEFPQITSSCRVSEPREFELGIPGDSLEGPRLRYFDEDEVLAVDSSFLEFFTFPVVSGDPARAFTSPGDIVITSSLAEKLFNDEDPIDKEIRIGEGGYFQVRAVVEDPPQNSTFQFKALLGFHILEEMGYPIDGHGGTMYYNCFKLEENTDLAELNERINAYVQEQYNPDLEASYFLDPFTRVHLHGESGGMQGVIMMGIMAVMILIIACINYINLSTAYSSQRLKEITVRKFSGAGKRQLILQFLGESYLLLMLAFYLGFFFAEQMVPLIDRSFGGTYTSISRGWDFWLVVVSVYLLTGIMAGLFPAIKIAGLQPLSFLQALKQKRGKTRSPGRQILIVTQFSFSIIFVVLSIFMIRQFEYMQKADLGFNRDEMLYMRTTGLVWDKYEEIKRELSELHFVKGVTTSSHIPMMINSGEIEWGEKDGDKNKIAVVLWTDADFISAFEIAMKEGRFFYPEADFVNHSYVVVNQSLIDILGWEDPVGRTFYMYEREYTILGVTENIDFFPFELEVFQDRAMIYRYEPVREYLYIRTLPEVKDEEKAEIAAIFESHNPGYEIHLEHLSDYQYEFLDSTEGMRFLAWLFSIVAISIALMGVVGLSVFNNNRKTKEVGIRKAMGCPASGIMGLLLSDFMRLVLISNIIGLSGSYFIARRLLRLFSYRIQMEASVYLLVAGLSLLLALVIVTALAWRTMRSNPIHSLRYE
jgi:ABC-type lipoprotein release transport system permease subunit